MQNYILLFQGIVLLLISIGIYAIYSCNFTSPSFISSILFSFGSFVAYFGNKDWRMPVKWSLPTIIIAAIFSMFVGEYIVRAMKQVKIRNCLRMPIQRIIYDIPLKFVAFLFVLGILADLLYYLRLCQIAGVGYTDFFRMLALINFKRHAIDVRIGIHIACLNILLSFSWSCLTFAYINNMVVLKNRAAYVFKRYLLIWIPYLLNIIIGGSRIFFISILSFVAFSLILLRQRYYGRKANMQSIKQLMRFLIIGIAGLFVVFTFMGELSGKIGDGNKAYDSFLVYAASSIVDLGIYVENGIICSNFPGNNTFLGLINTVSRVVTLPAANDVGMGYIKLGTGSITNVYTAFASYLVDFGFVGLFFIQLILGIVYTCIFLYITENRNASLSIITYLIIFLYGLVGQLFAAETVSGILSVNDIFRILVCFVYYYYVDRKYRRSIVVY